MIYLDRNLKAPEIVRRLSNRLPDGVRVFQPENLSDEDIYHRLASERGCFFVTHNTKDFYDQFDGHPKYCILCLEDMPVDDYGAIVHSVVQVLQAAPFRMTRTRNGCVIRANTHRAIWYRRRNEPFRWRLSFETGVIISEPHKP